MRFSVTSLIRLSIVLFLGVSAMAVGLSRLVPAPKGWRALRTEAYLGASEYFFRRPARNMCWFSLKDGKTTTMSLPPGESLDLASCSPWWDESGRSQVVGRWTKQTEAPGVEGGIARVSFPDGEILDRVPTDVVPASVPCWSPGTTASVIFTAGDGKLYRHAFESESSKASRSSRIDRDDRPEPLVWRCPTPGVGQIHVEDPSRPTDARFADLLLVSLRLTEMRPPGKAFYLPSQLWWLRLSEDGRSIKDAGRVLIPELRTEEIEERCPVLGRLSDGRSALVYLRKVGAGSWELRSALIRIDEAGRRPLPVADLGPTLADHCVTVPPLIAIDGRSVSVAQSNATLKTVSIPWLQTNRAAATSFASLRFGATSK